MDDQGREVLAWIDRDVPLPPYPAWAMTDQALTDLGGLVRRLHEATASFPGTTADRSTQWADPGGGSVICHNDLYPENVVFPQEGTRPGSTNGRTRAATAGLRPTMPGSPATVRR